MIDDSSIDPSMLRWSRRDCAFCGEFADAWADFTVPKVLTVFGHVLQCLDAYPICRSCSGRPRHILEAIVAAGFRMPD